MSRSGQTALHDAILLQWRKTRAPGADDGSLGETFMKLGKQGSTLAGMMDVFSIAISISLRYGVPLETFVSKGTAVGMSEHHVAADWMDRD